MPICLFIYILRLDLGLWRDLGWMYVFTNKQLHRSCLHIYTNRRYLFEYTFTTLDVPQWLLLIIISASAWYTSHIFNLCLPLITSVWSLIFIILSRCRYATYQFHHSSFRICKYWPALMCTYIEIVDEY